MDTIDGFWAGAQDHGDGVDLEPLRQRLGSWDAVVAAGADGLMSIGVPWPDALAWARTPPRETLGAAITLAHPRYPEALRRTTCPPPVLCVEGSLDALSPPAVAVVGTRDCTRYGRLVARDLGAALAAAGVSVVSGLARGIDGEAHEGALAAGRTVAVLGHGLLHTAPASHRDLRARILDRGGAMLTAFPDGVPPRPHTFPRRNAWITGLASAVIVVEAGVRSGALITARLAGVEGREVFAVPGPIGAPTSEGCLRLLDEGASVVVSVASLVQRLTGQAARARPSLVEALVSGAPLDEVARRRGQSVAEVLAEATMLELRGEVTRLGERRWAAREGG